MVSADGALGALAKVADGAAGGPVVVAGPAPGAGLGVEVIAGPEAAPGIRAALIAAGCTARGSRFVRFRDGTAELLDLILAGELGLPPGEIATLFGDASPIPGWEHLARPSPRHTLLLVARRVVERLGRLDAANRVEIERATREDPRAWYAAAELAPAWHADRSLELLERLAGHGFVPLAVRARILDRRLRADGSPPLQAHVTVASRLLPRRRRPVVVALSGLDGSGKSSQGRMLVDTLEGLGVACAIEWARLGEDRRLWMLRRAVSRVLRPRAPRVGGSGGGADLVTAPPRLSDRGGSIAALSAAVAALSSAWTYRRHVARYRGHADVLVYDRYLLDAAVQLRDRYRVSEPVARRVTALLCALAPPPAAAFYLDVPATTAQGRKREDRLEVLERHRALYLRLLGGRPGAGVTLLDGTRPVDQLAAAIGEAVWVALDAAGC